MQKHNATYKFLKWVPGNVEWRLFSKELKTPCSHPCDVFIKKKEEFLASRGFPKMPRLLSKEYVGLLFGPLAHGFLMNRRGLLMVFIRGSWINHCIIFENFKNQPQLFFFIRLRCSVAARSVELTQMMIRSLSGLKKPSVHSESFFFTKSLDFCRIVSMLLSH